jgi:alpha-L-fucosidase
MRIEDEADVPMNRRTWLRSHSVAQRLRRAQQHVLVAVLGAAAVIIPCASAPAQDDDRLAWWRDATFGLFIHWGVYAVAAGEWNGQVVPGVGEWIMHTARIPVSEYETLPPRFNPVKFDARAWAKTAREAGLRYMVITSKHHDGFCMFDSKETAWDIIDATPFRRDVLKELAEACREEGIRLGFYYSIMDWHHPDARGERFPVYVKYLHAQVRELLTNYGEIAILWFDGEWIEEWTAALGEELYRLCRELQPHIIVNNRVGKGRSGMGNEKTSAGDFGTPEQEIPAQGIPGYAWESCMTMNDSWGFKRSDENWKSAAVLTHHLIEIASKGGNFLLNVGPTAEGEIPAPSVERLRAMGSWLAAYGDAIYGCGPSPIPRLPWGRCTTRPGALYLHVFDWPPDGVLTVPGLTVEEGHAARLGPEKTLLPLIPTEDGMRIDAGRITPDPVATVIAINYDGVISVEEVPIREAADGSITLAAADAELRGGSIRLETMDGERNIGFWTSPHSEARWLLEGRTAGRRRIELTLACQPSNAGGEFVVAAAGAELRGEVPATGSWRHFVTVDAGIMEFPAAGRQELVIRPGERFTGALMNLRQVRLIPLPSVGGAGD